MLNVFYTPKQSVTNNPSFSPSAGKLRLVIESRQQQGLPIEIIRPKPLIDEDLALAHDPVFVRGALSGKMSNGSGNCSLEVAGHCLHCLTSLLAVTLFSIRLVPTRM